MFVLRNDILGESTRTKNSRLGIPRLGISGLSS